MSDKIKILAIVGEAGTGKDTVMRKLITRFNFNEIISYTTRPPRENEKDGVDYHFISAEEFYDKILNFEMLETAIYNDWFYGTSIDSLINDKINIGVFNLQGIDSLRKNHEIDLIVVRLEVNSKTRLLRQLEREVEPDVDEIVRRFVYDKKEFSDFEHEKINYNCITINNNSSLEETITNIMNILDKTW